MNSTVSPRGSRSQRVLLGLGLVFLTYALLGNYVALPGYLRFLARGGRSEAGHTADAAVVVGALKTISWMYSFQLGALCLVLSQALKRGAPVRTLAWVAGGWLAIWSVPGWPAPGAWFYLVFGTALLVAVGFALTHAPLTEGRAGTLRSLAMLFFAFATWEVCGLGTTGRMLHPAEPAAPMAHALLVTQSSKLMLELVVAWGAYALSLRTQHA